MVRPRERAYALGARRIRRLARTHQIHGGTGARGETGDRSAPRRREFRESTTDAALYAESKRLFAKREWGCVQEYADAKQPLIAQIMERAYAWQSEQRSAKPRP